MNLENKSILPNSKLLRALVVGASIFFSNIPDHVSAAQPAGQLSWEMPTELSNYLDKYWKVNGLNEKTRIEVGNHCNLMLSIIGYLPEKGKYMQDKYGAKNLGKICFAFSIAALEQNKHFGRLKGNQVFKNPFTDMELVNQATDILKKIVNPRFAMEMRRDVVDIGIAYVNSFKK